jgi:biotin carboxyl carrier protein
VKYEVTVGERVFEVDVEGESVRVSGRSARASILAVSGSPLMRVMVDGVSRTYAMSRDKDGWRVHSEGRLWVVDVSDERARSLRQMVGNKHSRAPGGLIKAPMPGLVLRVEVEVGQHVTAGSGLVVLEAMKMENEIRSTQDGVVQRILVRPGQAVDKGAELVEVVAGGQG